MIEEINSKIQTFLKRHNPFSEECQVVYFMSEVRKILEHSDELAEKLPMLKCYCDWTLHNAKRYSHGGWKIVFELLNEGIEMVDQKKYLVDINKSMSFFYGLPLKYELHKFFKAQELSLNYLENEEWWKNFRIQLFNVLIDQPIENPIDEIIEIRYKKVTNRQLCCIIKFKDKRGEIPFEFPI